ncbi:TrmB family transcriptional regulator [Haloprofundus salilacus]|uniref:TrmB family transcriptional regulator n=1 Tax=Haloprofundus salilacus TaxID=2876190 RepID=UPI001CC9FB86|nr:TrmB family transcriptional regulator [Haloprofundus salilacus]
MDTDQLRSTLERTGLTQYEADAYIATVELGSAPATEIADACGVPQARIYDVLRNLESDGYIETYQQGSLHARAHDPSAVVGDLQAYAETVTNAAAEIRDRWERPTVENHRVSVLKPLSSIFDRAREAIEDAENELQLALTPAQFDLFRDVLSAAVDRGVVVKLTLTPESSGDSVDEREFAFAGVATEVRLRTLPTPFLVLADRIHVCFAPEAPLHPNHEYGVLVNDYSLSRVFDSHFQTAFWETWEPLYSARDGSLPATYTNIRECIRDIHDDVEAGRKVTLTVTGQDRTGRQKRELTGRVADVNYVAGDGDAGPLLSSFVEAATLELDTGDEVVSVGGWGALVEDIEGQRFVVGKIE